MRKTRSNVTGCEFLEPRRLLSGLTWHNAANSPTIRAEGSKAVVDGKMYIFGGFVNDDTLAVTKEVDAYDPVNNTWTRMADMPAPETHGGTAVVGEDIWVAGFFYNNGISASKLVYIYHTQTNLWSRGPSLPAGRGAVGMAAIGNVIHVWGGLTGMTTSAADHWALDTTNQTAGWQTLAPLPQKLDHVGGVTLDGKLWSLGGFVDKQETTGNLNDVYAYDPATNAWTGKTPLPLGLGHIGPDTTVVGDKIIIAGGQVDASFEDEITNVIEYDPSTGASIELTGLPEGRKSADCGYADGELIVACGNQNNSPYLSQKTFVAKFDVDGNDNLPSVAIANAAAQVGGDVIFTAQLSTASPTTVTANFAVAAGSAPRGDFDSGGGTISFAAGSTQALIDIHTFADTRNADETFTVTLSALSTNAVFANGSATELATGTIHALPVTIAASTTALNISSSAIAVGEPVTLIAMVTEASGVASGNVTFLNGSAILGTATLDANGSAQLTTNSLLAGVNVISAHYAGNPNVSQSSSPSATVTVSTVALLHTTTTLTPSAATLVVGQTNRLTVTVASTVAGAIPTGMVTLTEDGNPVGTYTLDAQGIAVVALPVSAAVSATNFTAIYSGDATCGPSTSNIASQVDLPASVVTAAIGKTKVPSSGIAGQLFVANIAIPLRNTGPVQRGTFTLNVFADTSGVGLSSSAVDLGTVERKLVLRPNAKGGITLGLRKLPVDLPAGTYHIVALLTDPEGQSQLVTVPTTFAVAAPVVSLDASMTSPVVKANAKTVTLTLRVINIGNIRAEGLMNCVITADDTAGNHTGLNLYTQAFHVNLKPRSHGVYHLRVTIPADAATRALYTVVTVQLADVTATATDPTLL